jgi:FixJ family two-component response regulator
MVALDKSGQQTQAKQLLARARTLLGGDWDSDKASEIYEESEDLAQATQKTEQPDLSEALLGFSAYFSSFVDGSMMPRAAQIAQLRALLDSVADALQRLANDVQVSDIATNVRETEGEHVYLLSAKAGLANTLLARFSGKSFGVKQFNDAKSLLRALLKSSSKALVIDAELLIALRAEIKAMGEGAPNLPPCVVISERDGLGLRLQANRIGAEGFLLWPSEARGVGDRLQELISDRASSYQVMIVDDDVSMTMFCASILKRNGMNVQSHNHPEAALRAVSSFRPEVILVDLYMPDISGLELLELFRAHPATMFTPVILLSGDEDAEKRFDTLIFGGDDYPTKPIRPRHLVAAVTARAKRARWMKREFKRG